MNGTLGILNVGVGDTKLSFDPKNQVERIRAARIVRDMIRRGYALLVEVERDGVKGFERALDFRDDTCEYIVADFDPTVEAASTETKDKKHGHQSQQAEAAADSGAGAQAAPAKPRGGKRAVAAASTRAVGVAPISGG